MQDEGRSGDALLFVLIAAGMFLVVVFALTALAATANRAMEPQSWAERQCADTGNPDFVDSPEGHACIDRVLARPAWHSSIRWIAAAGGCFAGAYVVAALRGARSLARDIANDRRARDARRRGPIS